MMLLAGGPARGVMVAYSLKSARTAGSLEEGRSETIDRRMNSRKSSSEMELSSVMCEMPERRGVASVGMWREVRLGDEEAVSEWCSLPPCRFCTLS